MKAVPMSFHPMRVVEKIQGMAAGMFAFFLSLMLTSAVPAASQETWNCEQTAFYGVYEDPSLTKGEATSSTKPLKWINANTIGFESLALERMNPGSETFFNQASESTLHVYQTERPYWVILTQPQVWMNKFGNLRVRFYRCTP
jgi:hypothetical protein